MVVVYYRPQRSCGQGYVFTRVCDSVNRGEGVSAEPPPRTKENPPGPRRTPPPGTKENPPGTKENPPRPGRPPPGTRADPPPPGRTLQHTVNERPVRILLECILILWSFCFLTRLRLVWISPYTYKYWVIIKLLSVDIMATDSIRLLLKVKFFFHVRFYFFDLFCFQIKQDLPRIPKPRFLWKFVYNFCNKKEDKALILLGLVHIHSVCHCECECINFALTQVSVKVHLHRSKANVMDSYWMEAKINEMFRFLSV